MSDPGGGGSASGAGAAAAGLAEVFAAERPRLVGLAYRMTGSRLDAEDIVQEAWLRAQRADWDGIEKPAAWLTTVVSRLALDDLKSARRRRERYVGPWLPEPVRTPAPLDALLDAAAQDAVADPALDADTGSGTASWEGRSGGAGPRVGVGIGLAGGPVPGGADASLDGTSRDPAEVVELAETLTLGFLRLLDTLEPVERVVFLLADVFDTPYREIAPIVDRSPEACRQVASRARRKVRAERPRHDPPENAARVAAELLVAVAAGDVERTMSLLAEDVVLVSDGGPDVHAARRPVLGPFRVARFLINVGKRVLQVEGQMMSVNGEPALVARVDGQPVYLVCAEVAGGVVHAVHIVNNPTKLAALDLDTPIT